MHTALEREIFRAGQRHSRSCDTLYRGVVSKVGKQYRSFYRARAFEIVHEVLRFFKRNTYGGEHDSKFSVAALNLSLPCNLRGKLGVRQTAHREYGQLLSAHERVQPVDCGYARLNKFVGIVACGGIYRLAVNIHHFIGNNGSTSVAGVTHTVEHPPQHIP